MTLSVDVLVVGGGPAGLAAATELARLRAWRVMLVERDTEFGGIPRHCAHSPFGMREFGRVLGGAGYAARLAARAVDAGAELRSRHAVTALRADGADLATPDGPVTVTARRIVVATGIREASRAGRLLPGQRPLGIVTTGALQDYVHLRRLVPFRRPLIAGSELVTMSAILTCRSAGIRPVALVEDEAALRIGMPIGLFPTLMGIPVHLRTHIVDIFGRDRVEAVRLRHADGAERTIDCDGVLLSGRFTPESSLARLAGLRIDAGTGGPAIDPAGRTSVPAIYAAGNVRRAVKTAGHCWSEGRRVAAAVVASLREAG